MRTVRRIAAIVFLAVGALGLLPAAGRAQAPDRTVFEVPVTGIVDPFVANHVQDVITKAEEDGAAAVLLTIDTPGGLGTSMRDITEAVLAAKVPVIGYVSPSGAQAASAGTFILLSCPIAAMAPATNVGAAHPVGLAGVIESEKATNDAASYIRSLQDHYDRNADWAETAVRDSASIPASEALDLGVIDTIAPNVTALLDDLDGESVTLGDGKTTVTLETAGANVQVEELGAFVGFVHSLLDPNLAFIFFWVGLALIVIEFFVPGGVAGTLGLLLFITSLVSLGSLPVQLIGVVFLVASIVFFVLELLHPGVGFPSIAGVICVLLGGWFLYDTAGSGLRVSPLVIVPVAGLAALFFLVVVRAAMRMRHREVISRDVQMVGRDGVALRDLDPRGVVQVAAEQWSAQSTTGRIPKGERVRVVSMEGLKLRVEPAPSPSGPGGLGPSGAPSTDAGDGPAPDDGTTERASATPGPAEGRTT